MSSSHKLHFLRQFDTPYRIPSFGNRRKGFFNVVGSRGGIAVAVEPTESHDRASVILADLFELASRCLRTDPALMFASDATSARDTQAYKLLVSLGKRAVPFVLREYERQDGIWSLVLEDILNENPVSPEDFGDSGRVRKAWLDWGKANGHLS